MELALTLVSIASFFALIATWAIMPVSERTAETHTAPSPQAQAAH